MRSATAALARMNDETINENDATREAKLVLLKSLPVSTRQELGGPGAIGQMTEDALLVFLNHQLAQGMWHLIKRHRRWKRQHGFCINPFCIERAADKDSMCSECRKQRQDYSLHGAKNPHRRQSSYGKRRMLERALAKAEAMAKKSEREKRRQRLDVDRPAPPRSARANSSARALTG